MSDIFSSEFNIKKQTARCHPKVSWLVTLTRTAPYFERSGASRRFEAVAEKAYFSAVELGKSVRITQMLPKVLVALLGLAPTGAHMAVGAGLPIRYERAGQ